MLLLPASGPCLHGRLSSNVRPQVHKQRSRVLASAPLPEVAPLGRRTPKQRQLETTSWHGQRGLSSLSRIGANAETEPVGGAPQQEQPRRDDLLDSQFVEPAADAGLPSCSTVSRAAGTVTAEVPRRAGLSAHSSWVSMSRTAGASPQGLTVAA